MRTGAEAGGARPQAQAGLGPQKLDEAGRPLPRSSAGSAALPHLHHRLLASRNGRDECVLF